MTTNAELITEARHVFETWSTTPDIVRRLADALEASEAQVVRLRAQIIENDLRYLAKLPPVTTAIGAWPADLLTAVQHLAECKHDEPLGLYQMQACRKCIEARAVLVRYGLLK